MYEIDINENLTGLKVFINGVPDLTLIPKDEFDSAIAALEQQIVDYNKGNQRWGK